MAGISRGSLWDRRFALSIGVLAVLFTLLWQEALFSQQPVADAKPPVDQTANRGTAPVTSSGTMPGDVDWGALPWAFVGIAALFGAIGGVVYELIALQGNIEWPHRSSTGEHTTSGYDYAALPYLYDLGILARIFIGAAAAIVAFWVMPVVDGLQLIAVSLVAGSAGIAVFRSIQDRLIAQLNAAKTATIRQGLAKVLDDVVDLETAVAQRVGAGIAPDGSGEEAAAIQTRASSIRGQVKALLEIGALP